MSSLSLVFVPFLKIGRQGKEKMKEDDEEGGGIELNGGGGEGGGVTRSNSQSSLWSSASARFYTGRWGDGCVGSTGSGSEAWGFGPGEAGRKWSGLERFEVCLKCGLERVVVQVQQLPVEENDLSGLSAGSMHEVPAGHPHGDIKTGEANWSCTAPDTGS